MPWQLQCYVQACPGLRSAVADGLVQQYPDSNFPLTPQMTLQGYLTKLDMGNLVSTGMLSVNVLFSNDIQVRHIPAHTALHMGIS